MNFTKDETPLSLPQVLIFQIVANLDIICVFTKHSIIKFTLQFSLQNSNFAQHMTIAIEQHKKAPLTFPNLIDI